MSDIFSTESLLIAVWKAIFGFLISAAVAALLRSIFRIYSENESRITIFLETIRFLIREFCLGIIFALPVLLLALIFVNERFIPGSLVFFTVSFSICHAVLSSLYVTIAWAFHRQEAINKPIGRALRLTASWIIVFLLLSKYILTRRGLRPGEM